VKRYALAITMECDVDRPRHIVFGIVETAAETICASLVHDCCLRSLAGSCRAGGTELVTTTPGATVVCMAAGSLLIARCKRHPATPAP